MYGQVFTRDISINASINYSWAQMRLFPHENWLHARISARINFSLCFRSWRNIKALKRPQRRRQREPHKFAYLILQKKRNARAISLLYISTPFNFSPRIEKTCLIATLEVNIWGQSFILFFFSDNFFPNRSYQFNSRIVCEHFASQTTWK